MIYRKYGKTGEEVSQLGFGCMRFPLNSDDPRDINTQEAIRIIHYAIDNGVNYFDTAYPYHGTSFSSPVGGASEPLLAKAFQGGKRNKIKLATKMPTWVVNTRNDMDKYLDLQLSRIETDYIDYYLVHALNKHSWKKLTQNNLFDFLDTALKSGKIKHAGFSFHDDLNTFKKIVDSYNWKLCLIQYNYIDQNFQAGKEGLRYAHQRELGVSIMEPLRGGALINNLPENVLSEFKKSKLKREPVDWAFRWLLNHPEISVVLSGMSTFEQVKQNISIASDAKPNAMSEQELEVMKKVQTAFKSRIKINCTSCGYCLPCPHGVNIPRNFQIYNNYYLLDKPAQQMAKQQYKTFLPLPAGAGGCTNCGLCEPKCPQQIPIIKNLKEVKDLMEQ